MDLPEEKIIIFRVGWMKYYRGPYEDDIYSAAKFVQSEKYGHEMYNFLPYKGDMYGFVQPSGKGDYYQRVIRIERLGADKHAESVKNILIAWVAPKAEGGIYLVGWYRHATIFREHQKPLLCSRRLHIGGEIGYYATAREKDCVLLLPEERTLSVPKATKGMGGLGQSSVWYADSGKPNDELFRERFLEYVNKFYENEPFVEFFNEYSPPDDADIQLTDKVFNIPQLDETTRRRLQSSRIGQKGFRENLIQYWKGCCAVTGFDDERILRASHIKPWRDCDNFERLDVFNGFLLTPNLDVAFDKGLITFDRQGIIMLSSSFWDKAKRLCIADGLKVQLDERHQHYLDFHRENIFKL